MPRRSRATDNQTSVTPAAAPAFRVLLVDPDAKARRALVQAANELPIELVAVGTLQDARAAVANSTIHLALVEPGIDADAMTFVRALREAGRTQAVVLTAQPRIDTAIEALRAGAADFLLKPIDAAAAAGCVRDAMKRHEAGAATRQRIERLRRVCKKLNQSRDEMSQQVDILCNDLVTAYQELATQMQQVAQTGEFVAIVRHELDLENLLRRTLEFLLQKAGPTNAAVFLPSGSDEYSLGGYVNYDCGPDSADMLLQHLADVMAPKVAVREGVLHVTDNATLAQWLGDDSAYLADSHVLAFPCVQDRETLAVISLFRDGGEPFDPSVVDLCGAIAPLLADCLAKVVRIHHRHLPAAELEDDDEMAA